MKSCPTCNRTFEDTLTFCLADGSLLSAPSDPQATQRMPASRKTDPPPTEVMSAAASSSSLPPTQPAINVKDLPPTIASPLPSTVKKHERSQALPIQRSTPFYIYPLAMVAGLAVGLLFNYPGFRHYGYYVPPLAILLTYGFVGVFFGYVWSQKGWKWGLWIVVIWWPVEVFLKLYYLRIHIEFGSWWFPFRLFALLILISITACIGAYLGAQLSLKRISR
jgi:hypothetical protein